MGSNARVVKYILNKKYDKNDITHDTVIKIVVKLV